MKFLWITLGWTSVGLAIAGALLPLLPTTPFLLLAAFAFSKGSTHLHDWLMTHPQLGPPIHNWQAYRAVSRRVKIYASISMLGIFVLSIVLAAPWWAVTMQGIILAVVAIFLWRCSEGPPPPVNTLSPGGKKPTEQI